MPVRRVGGGAGLEFWREAPGEHANGYSLFCDVSAGVAQINHLLEILLGSPVGLDEGFKTVHVHLPSRSADVSGTTYSACHVPGHADAPPQHCKLLVDSMDVTALKKIAGPESIDASVRGIVRQVFRASVSRDVLPVTGTRLGLCSSFKELLISVPREDLALRYTLLKHLMAGNYNDVARLLVASDPAREVEFRGLVQACAAATTQFSVTGSGQYGAPRDWPEQDALIEQLTTVFVSAIRGAGLGGRVGTTESDESILGRVVERVNAALEPAPGVGPVA